MFTISFVSFRVRTALLLLMMFIVSFAAFERYPAMKLNAFASGTATSKPLIDSQLPKKLATATFAMG